MAYPARGCHKNHANSRSHTRRQSIARRPALEQRRLPDLSPSPGLPDTSIKSRLIYVFVHSWGTCPGFVQKNRTFPGLGKSVNTIFPYFQDVTGGSPHLIHWHIICKYHWSGVTESPSTLTVGLPAGDTSMRNSINYSMFTDLLVAKFETEKEAKKLDTDSSHPVAEQDSLTLEQYVDLLAPDPYQIWPNK